MRKFLAAGLAISMFCMAGTLSAQRLIIYVEPGETMYVAPTDTLHAYGLGLTPNITLDLTGISIERNPTLTNPLSRPINRSFTFTPSAPAFSGLYKFWYEADELNGIPKSDLQLFYHTTGWSIVPTETHDTVQQVITSQTTVINPVELTLSTLAAPLPVTWLGVTANKKGRDVQVTWKTAEESNLETYMVMHSTNSMNWTAIGTALPKGAAENNYSFLHVSAPAGKNYYRIKAKELSGEMKYSKIVSVNMDDPGQLSIYPNPSNGRQNATLRLSKPGYVQLWRSNGSLVSSSFYNAGTHSINSSKLTPGTYLISDGQTVVKWIIQ